MWVADILSKYVVHDNGRTTYELITQHTAKHKVIGFAEKVHFQLKIPVSKRNACSNEKSGVGDLLGIVNRNTEYLIATENGIVACTIVRRMQDSEAYDSACKNVVSAKYTDFVRGGPRTWPIAVHVPASVLMNPDPSPIPTTYIPRSTYLRPKYVASHGFSRFFLGFPKILKHFLCFSIDFKAFCMIFHEFKSF